MRKRMLSLVLAAILCLSLLPFGAAAEEIVYDGTCGADGDNVIWTLDSEGLLTISGSGKMYDYGTDFPPWLELTTQGGSQEIMTTEKVTSVIVDSGVTSIGDCAFAYCLKLTSAEIPDSVTSIGEWAFQETNLTNVKIPNSVTRIENGVFAGCDSLTSVEIPDSVTSIGEWAFEGCTGLTGVKIPNSVRSIEDNTFYWCNNLTSMEIPESVTNIGEAAFAMCTSLTNVDIPNSVTSIKPNAFYGCSSLLNVEIPESVTNIGDSAFRDCSGLMSIKIPDGVTSIGEAVFCRCSSLTNVKIPNSVTRIENGVFAGCDSLTSVYIPDSVTNIGEWTFEGCINLKDVYYNGTQEQWDSIQINNGNEPLTNATLHLVAEITPAPATPDPTEEPISTPAPTAKPTATPAPTAKPTATPAPTAKPTATPAPTAKPTAAPAPTAKPTATPAPTAKPTTTPVPTAKPTAAPAPTAKPTASPAPTAKPTASPAPAANPFKDVSKDQYYYEPVLWAVNHDPQITAGTSATTFSPENPCTRGQMVTFLWRAKGCPEPKLTKNPFTDVKSSDYFYKAVLWAVENEITAGTSQTTFSPAATVTRAQTVTFLWRTEGKPAVQTKNPFTDVPAGQYYTDAVLWAVKNNITAGTSATTFSPSNPCTRGQIVTFLYRDMK